MHTDRKLRFAVIARSDRLPAWQMQCIKLLIDSGCAEWKLLLTVAPESPSVETRGAHSGRSPESSLLKWFRRSAEQKCPALRPANLSGRQLEVERLALQPFEENQHFYSFCESDVAKVRIHELDFLLLFDSLTLGGEILNAPRNGVWSFRHGAALTDSNLPALQEICRGEPVTKSVLQRISNDPKESVILYEGIFPTIAHSWSQNLNLIYFGCAEWPLRICRGILNGCVEDFNSEPRAMQASADASPTNLQLLRAFFVMGSSFVRKQFRDLFIRDQWHVGVIRAPICSLLENNGRPAIQWLPPIPRTRFFADSFALCRDGELTILFEDYDRLSGIGVISSVHSSDGARKFSVPERVDWALDDGGHKSYPYLFEDGGEIYCLPETCSRNELALYRAASFPQKWERVCTLLENTPAVDSTIFRHGEYWWMFYTTSTGGTNVKLYVAFATSLFGPWTQHPANPVKTDVRSARPGGTPFVHEGLLYRPGQDSSRTYGGNVVIHRVDKLTPTQFEEQEVRRLEPDRNSRYSQGIHTIAAAGEMCVVDGKHFVFVPELLPAMLWGKLRAIARRGAPAVAVTHIP